MRKNNHLVVITLILIVIVSLFYVNLSMKYSGKNIITNVYVANNNLVKANNSIITKEKDEEEEINLGDTIAHCASQELTCEGVGGTLQDGVCKHTEYYNGCTSKPSSACNNWSSARRCCIGRLSRVVVDGNPWEKCTACNSGYQLVDNECGKCEFGLKANADTVSPDTEWCAEVVGKNKFCTSELESNCTIAKNSCVKSTIKVTLNGVTHSTSIPVAGRWQEAPKDDDGKVRVPETPSASTVEEADAWIGSDRADMDATMAYGDNCKVTDEEGKVECDSYFTRGKCGAQPIKTYSYCCVDNQYIGTSSEKAKTGDNQGGVKWADHVLYNHDQMKNGKYGCAYYFGNNYTLATNPDGSTVPKNKCSPPEIINRCSSTPKTLTNQVSGGTTTQCEEEVTLKYNEGEKCSDNSDGNIQNSFFAINCSRTVKANFDYGDDGRTDTPRDLYKGQGFKYGITIKTIIECDKSFYDDIWKKSYSNILERLRTIDYDLAKFYHEEYNATKWLQRYQYLVENKDKFKSGTVAKDVFMFWNILDELLGVVKSYNNYSPDNQYNETATLDFNYNVDGKTVTLSRQVPNQSIFIKNVDEGVYQEPSSTVNLNVEGKKIKGLIDDKGKLQYPKNGKKTNIAHPRTVKLVPNEMYVNTTTGTLQTINNSGYSGGNKIYIDYYANTPQVITPINIIVTGYAGSDSLKLENAITNNKCTLKVKDMEIIYRPIDVSNPFINNTWAPGKNWVNSQFDFRNIIHSNIWSTSSYYAKYTNDTWN